MNREEIQKNSEHWYNKYKDAEKRIEELENKIADIKANCDLAIEGRDIKIKELEKENAELKADNDARKFAMAMSEKVEKQLREYLTKAKEIIREIMKFDIPTLDYEKAEQFLRKTDIDNAIQKADEEKDAWQKYYDFGR